jgi:hypothetical protein
VIPSPLVCLLLALAALRVYRLAALDTFPPLVRARNWTVGATFTRAGKASFARPLLADWLVCAWCSGLAYSAAWYTAWLVEPTWTLYAAVPLALSAAVGAVQSLLPE